MKIYDSFQQFWNDLAVDKPNSYGFHDWTLVQVMHTSDKEYAKLQQDGTDELGFQPLFITFANPTTKAVKQMIVKNVNDATAKDFKHFARERYADQFAQRFGSFRPAESHAFTEYEDWDEFYSVWLEDKGQPFFMHNIPLLFDHTPKIEYWTRKQTGQHVLPYQRLLITTYFVSSNEFYDFFIKQVNDEEAARIKLLMQSRIGMNIDQFYEADV